jgi:glyoxylase-like metal-dependent hydrolase (beta-lactamase superfamily II)
MIHEVIPVGWLQCNCSVLGDTASREAIVVDPGDEVERILAIIAQHRLKVRAIINTHAHIDHVGGLVKVHEATGAPVLMHREDLELYRILETQAHMIGTPAPPMMQIDQFLRDGDVLRWGPYQGRVIHTPGHSQGSCCLHIPRTDAKEVEEVEDVKGMTRAMAIEESKLIAGDTLFAGSIGRTDLWGGSLDAILKSIQTKLLTLPDDTVVYPGHGPATTIGDEREMNPFLQRM